MRQVKKLREIANISAGQGAPQGEDSCCDYGTPFVKAGNLIELLNGKRENEVQKVNENVAKAHKLKLYPAGTVLFAKSGMSCMKGYVYQLQSPCYVVSHLACITATDVSGEYLKYYFEFHKPNSLVKDEAYPSISLADIGDMAVSYGNFDEQREIVMTLDKVRKAIELRRMELNKIDDLVKSQFIEMFGVFDLRKSQATWKKIGTVADVVGGSTPKTEKDEFWGGRHHWITPAEIKEDSFVIKSTVRTLTDAGVKSCSLKLLPVGTVLLSSRAPIGKVAIAGVEMYCNQGFKNLICGKNLNSIYVYCLLKYNSDYLNSLGRGATFKEISKSIVDGIAIPVPPLELQNQFARFVEQTDKSKFRIKQSLEKLEICYKALLQKYFG